MGWGIRGITFFLQSLRFLTELLTFYVIVLIKLGSSSSNTCAVYKPFIPAPSEYLHSLNWREPGGMIVLYLCAQLAVLYTYDYLVILIYYRLSTYNKQICTTLSV